MVAEGQTDKMASDMEVQMKQRRGNEFSVWKKMASIDIHGHLVNNNGDQIVDVSTVRQWVLQFSCSGSDSESSPLVQMYMNATYRLLIAGENTQLTLVTALKNSVL